MRRLFAVVATAAALAVPTSVATLGIVPAGMAGAASGISCSTVKLTGPLATGTLTIKGCTPSGGKGYKSATASSAALQAGGSLVWSSSHATTTVSITPTSPGQGVCKKGYVEFDANGHVTAASTKGAGIPAVGDTIHAVTCIDIAKNKLKLVGRFSL
jgi:hypothetical protein